MPRIVHASDLHFGKPHDPEAAEVFLRSVHELRPDLIVLAGDFTQRAKVREFEAARAFIDRMPDVPVVVTPGNHDVPLYRVFERLFTPFRNYRRYIEDRLDSVTRIPGVTVVALNTAAPRTAIVNGTVREHQLGFAQTSFAAAAPGDLKVAMLHHHMAVPGDYSYQPPLPIRERVLEILEAAEVDVVLSGHLHRGYVKSSAQVFQGSRRGILIVNSGTATSTRGRSSERKRNSFFVHDVGPEQLEVAHYMYFRGEGALRGGRESFLPIARHVFPRLPATSLDRGPGPAAATSGGAAEPSDRGGAGAAP